jgi:hypothetical protein
VFLACLHDSQKSTIRWEIASKAGYCWRSGITAMVNGWTKGRPEQFSFVNAWYSSQLKCPSGYYGVCSSYISRYS